MSIGIFELHSKRCKKFEKEKDQKKRGVTESGLRGVGDAAPYERRGAAAGFVDKEREI